MFRPDQTCQPAVASSPQPHHIWSYKMGLVKSHSAALLASVALGMIMSQGAAAQTPVNATYVTLLERLVIGLGGAPKVAIDTPQAVTVVTGDDIDQLQATTTGDIFARSEERRLGKGVLTM